MSYAEFHYVRDAYRQPDVVASLLTIEVRSAAPLVLDMSEAPGVQLSS